MADIPETYEIETLDQLRTLSDELRMRILSQLGQEDLTATQVARRVGVSPTRAHYHVRELERVGLAHLVETREKGGVLEKYYRAVARSIIVPPAFFQRTPALDEAVAIVQAELYKRVRAFLRIAERELSKDPLPPHVAASFLVSDCWMIPEDYAQVMKQLTDILRPYEAPRGRAGERVVTFNLINYEADVPEQEDGEEVAPGTS